MEVDEQDQVPYDFQEDINKVRYLNHLMCPILIITCILLAKVPYMVESRLDVTPRLSALVKLFRGMLLPKVWLGLSALGAKDH